jgi:hypothetical protein
MFEEKKAEWLRVAESLKPTLSRETVRPVSGMPDHALTENESVILDFGNHFVGHLTLKLSSKAATRTRLPGWQSNSAKMPGN